MQDFYLTTNLEAALLDQKVAGAFHGKRYAYVTVIDDKDGWALVSPSTMSPATTRLSARRSNTRTMPSNGLMASTSTSACSRTTWRRLSSPRCADPR